MSDFMRTTKHIRNGGQHVGQHVIEAVSCGGVVINRGKVLLLYKNQNGKYIGWVLPKGTIEEGENYKQTALREVKEETGISAKIVKYIGNTHYSFRTSGDMVSKTVHWYLMLANTFVSKPQAEEYFSDAGFYKRHEAYHLLKFHDEKQIMARAYHEYDGILAARHGNGDKPSHPRAVSLINKPEVFGNTPKIDSRH